MFEQLNLFAISEAEAFQTETISETSTPNTKTDGQPSGESTFFIPTMAYAKSCFTQEEHPVTALQDYFKSFVPKGEYAIQWPNSKVLALYPVDYTPSEIKPGHLYSHYLIGDQLYGSIFVGSEEEEEESES